jgi:hypothetical protein
MVFKWFDTTAVDAMADRVARDLIDRLPPATVGSEGKKAEAKQRKTLDLVLRQAHDFATVNKLNFYTKARLANRFKWVLIEAGYPRQYVDDVSYELAMVVSSAQSAKAS